MNYRKILFIWLVLIMFSGGVYGQVYSEHFIKNYKASSKSTVEVVNKYGKVHVIVWQKDSVKIEVDLRVSASDQKKLDKLKSNITFDFTSTNYYIIAHTKFTKSGGVFSDVVETIIPSNDVAINYTLYIPNNLNLKIDNKFGDIYIDDFSGNLDLVLSNGALKANSLEGNSSIQLNSADAIINKIKSGKATLRYSDIELKNVDKLNLDTKFSKIDIGKAKHLKVESRRDSYSINEVTTLSGTGDFTKMQISLLKDELNFSNKYYSLTVEDVNPTFNIINIASDLTDVELRFVKGTAYNLDVTHHPDVFLTYPKAEAKLETKELNDENKMLYTYGIIGKSTLASLPTVKIFAEKKCYINLLQK